MAEWTTVEEKRNDILKRKEVLLKTSYAGKATPSEADVKKDVADKIKAKENVVVIKKINQSYGSPYATISAFVYDDEASLKKIETINKKKKPEAAKPAGA